MCLTSHTHSLTPTGTIHIHPHASSHILTTSNDHLGSYSRALSQPASPHIVSLRSERSHQQQHLPPARMSDPPRRWARVTRAVCIGERGRDMSEVCSTPTTTERSTQASVGGETNNGWRAPNACTPVCILPYPAHSLVSLSPHYIWSTSMMLMHDANVGFDS